VMFVVTFSNLGKSIGKVLSVSDYLCESFILIARIFDEKLWQIFLNPNSEH